MYLVIMDVLFPKPQFGGLVMGGDSVQESRERESATVARNFACLVGILLALIGFVLCVAVWDEAHKTRMRTPAKTQAEKQTQSPVVH